MKTINTIYYNEWNDKQLRDFLEWEGSMISSMTTLAATCYYEKKSL